MVRPTHEPYSRRSVFSYDCHGCGRCCYDKIIHLNPYEVSRLAQNREMGTTDFLERYTAANGTALKQRDDGSCIFLRSQGCGVHQDRPLVCRLYPLGRRVTAEGEEWFSEAIPHPETEGEYGTEGTVNHFLARQGAHPFIEAVDRYVDLAGKMSQALRKKMANDSEVRENIQDIVEGYDRQANDFGIPDTLDMDLVIESWCTDHGVPVPSGINKKMNLHIHIIEEWLRRE